MNALISIAGIAFFILVVSGPYQKAVTDTARQSIFEARNALFDLAMTGKLDFASPEYRGIRSKMEQHIRFAHIVTLPRVLFILLFWVNVKDVKKSNDVYSLAKKIVDRDTRKKVCDLIEEAEKANLKMLVAKSPSMIILALLLLPIYLLWRVRANRAVKRMSRAAWQEVDREADYSEQTLPLAA